MRLNMLDEQATYARLHLAALALRAGEWMAKPSAAAYISRAHAAAVAASAARRTQRQSGQHPGPLCEHSPTQEVLDWQQANAGGARVLARSPGSPLTALTMLEARGLPLPRSSSTGGSAASLLGRGGSGSGSGSGNGTAIRKLSVSGQLRHANISESDHLVVSGSGGGGSTAAAAAASPASIAPPTAPHSRAGGVSGSEADNAAQSHTQPAKRLFGGHRRFASLGSVQ